MQIAPGIFQTRNNRVVRIDLSVQIQMPAKKPGDLPTTKLMWDGVLLRGDAKTIESRFRWEKDGAFPNNGLSHPYDLVQKIQ